MGPPAPPRPTVGFGDHDLDRDVQMTALRARQSTLNIGDGTTSTGARLNDPGIGSGPLQRDAFGQRQPGQRGPEPHLQAASTLD